MRCHYRTGAAGYRGGCRRKVQALVKFQVLLMTKDTKVDSLSPDFGRCFRWLRLADGLNAEAVTLNWTGNWRFCSRNTPRKRGSALAPQAAFGLGWVTRFSARFKVFRNDRQLHVEGRN